MTQILSPK